MFYVTFQIKPPRILRENGIATRYYAIECPSMDKTLEVASDIYSLDGISYLKINKCGRLRKGVVILKSDGDYITKIV